MLPEAAGSCREDVKLGRSSGWNPIRAERSRYGIYAIVHKTSVDHVNKYRGLPDDTRDLHGNHTFAISSLRQSDKYARSDVTMTVDLHPRESRDLWFKPADQETTAQVTKPSRIAEYPRSGSAPTLDLLTGEFLGYWKQHAPGKWFRQAKIRTLKEGREGDGQEVEGLRRSRRVDGQEPEEQKPLEVVEREAKALRMPKREAREAEKAAAAAQPVVEPAAEGDHAPPEAADPKTGSRKSKPVTASTTSEGGVNLVESPTSQEKEDVPEPRRWSKLWKFWVMIQTLKRKLR
ncbi:hypothetical protein PHMEG_0002584 [Phytophthora megakarya]|uniref:Eukaryotic/viral aspartic protease n=1 Tax=Phytophthora megakarya TaxID=4795 RepID=A0A225X0F0_9STRA|nr:hypothetical protein PHMEG_0002584 [Phytophthora megakarya]